MYPSKMYRLLSNFTFEPQYKLICYRVVLLKIKITISPDFLSDVGDSYISVRGVSVVF